MENEIQVGDVVQALGGMDQAAIGIVLSVDRGSYLCWLRMPTDQGAQRITFRLKPEECVKIGRAKMIPTPKGQKPPPPQPRQQRPTTTKAQPVLPARETGAPTVAPPIEKAAQAGADLQAAQADEIDPALLQTAVFRGPSAFDAHNLRPPQPMAPQPLTRDPLVPEPQKQKRHVRMRQRKGLKPA